MILIQKSSFIANHEQYYIVFSDLCQLWFFLCVKIEVCFSGLGHGKSSPNPFLKLGGS